MSKSTIAAALFVTLSIFGWIVAYAAAEIPLRTVADMKPPVVSIDGGITAPRPKPLR